MSVKIFLIFNILWSFCNVLVTINQNNHCNLLLNTQKQNNYYCQEKYYSFQLFKQQFDKIYQSMEEQWYRQQIFIMNRQIICLHNSKPNKKYTMGINKFVDLTPEQFSNIYTMTYPSNNLTISYANKIVNVKNNTKFTQNNITQKQLQNIINIVKQTKLKKKKLNYKLTSTSTFNYNQINIIQKQQKNKNQSINRKTTCFPISFQSLKKNSRKVNQNNFKQNNQLRYNQFNQNQLFENIDIDWTSSSGSIKNQGRCGSCYAFATADALSALYSIQKFGLFVPLSIQQIIDCSKNGLTFGCNGGFLQGAYAFMQTNGIIFQFNYPYTSLKQHNKCLENKGIFKVSSIQMLQESNCQQLINALKKQPISVGIAGFKLSFYKNGIFDDCDQHINHAVLLVGFKSGIGWKIKNTWGKQWGEQGYAWLAQQGNQCGICDMAVVPYL